MTETLEEENDTENADVELEELQAPLLEVNVARPGRYEVLDLFRGLIMIIMAWDHAKDILIDTKQEGREFWQGEGATWRNNFIFFFARTISDICAPGFYFTMGISMVLFTESRLRRGLNLKEIKYHFLKRAAILFIMGRFVNICFGLPQLGSLFFGNKISPKLVGSTDEFGLEDGWRVLAYFFLGVFEVMTGLSMTMITAAFIFLPFFQHLKEHYKHYIIVAAWALFLIFIIVSNQVIVHYQYDDIANVTGKVPNKFPAGYVPPHTFFQWLVRLVVIPGVIFNGNAFLAYPLIPWISLTILGMGYGYSDFKHFQATGYNYFSLLGVIFLGLFIVLRCFGGEFGNLRGWPRGDGSKVVNPFIEFFYTNKYPPSLAYILLTMGCNFLLISIIASKWFEKASMVRKVLLIFGKVPLFYYGLHLLLIGSFCAVLSLVSGSYSRGKTLKLENIGFNFPFLVLVLVLLYPLCQWYYKFKATTNPNSLWRLL